MSCARRSGLVIQAKPSSSGGGRRAASQLRAASLSGMSQRPCIRPASFQAVGPCRITANGVIAVGAARQSFQPMTVPYWKFTFGSVLSLL